MNTEASSRQSRRLINDSGRNSLQNAQFSSLSSAFSGLIQAGRLIGQIISELVLKVERDTYAQPPKEGRLGKRALGTRIFKNLIYFPPLNTLTKFKPGVR